MSLIVGLVEGRGGEGSPTWYQNRGPGFNPFQPHINAAVHNNSHIPLLFVGYAHGPNARS
jgi:hypothetical protein